MTATVALRKLVAEIVSARGSATADHIQLALPHLDRRQIVNALCDARKEGYIHLAKKGRGPGHPGLWKPGGRTEVGIEPIRKVSSVFQLGNPYLKANGPRGGLDRFTVHWVSGIQPRRSRNQRHHSLPTKAERQERAMYADKQQFNPMGMVPGYGAGVAVAGLGAAAPMMANEAKQPEIQAMSDRLQGRIGDLEGALASLEVRLSTVLRQEPATATNPAPMQTVSTAMGGTMQLMGDRVGTMYDRVCTMLRLLEL